MDETLGMLTYVKLICTQIAFIVRNYTHTKEIPVGVRGYCTHKQIF